MHSGSNLHLALVTLQSNDRANGKGLSTLLPPGFAVKSGDLLFTGPKFGTAAPIGTGYLLGLVATLGHQPELNDLALTLHKNFGLLADF